MPAFVDLLATAGVPHRAAGNGEVWLCCPFCSDDRFRLGVNYLKDKGHCFNCQWRRGRHAVRSTLRQLKIRIAENDRVAGGTEEVKRVPPAKLPPEFMLLEKGSPLYWESRAYRYVYRRGISHSQIRRCRVGFCVSGKYSYRAVFPIWVPYVREGQRRRRVQGFVARDIVGNQEPKYLFPPGPKSLFNFQDKPVIVLSEGVFKCLRIERALGRSLDSGVASCAVLGSSLTETALEQLTQYQSGIREVVVWPDPDTPGRKGAVTTVTKLCSAGFKVSVVRSEQPPDDMSLRLLQQTWLRRRTGTPMYLTHVLMDEAFTDYAV